MRFAVSYSMESILKFGSLMPDTILIFNYFQFPEAPFTLCSSTRKVKKMQNAVSVFGQHPPRA
jgi:hypothetical protein